eukprot:10504400-Lingulodinium_polyedra.AAC.1
MARACVAHFAALKRRTARLTAPLCSMCQNAARQCGQTRALPLQRGEMRHARAHHARTISWRAHGARARGAFRRAETASR